MNAARLPSLILTGFPPPVDATVAWTTLIPDPAVVELNTVLTPMQPMVEELALALTLLDCQLGEVECGYCRLPVRRALV